MVVVVVLVEVSFDDVKVKFGNFESTKKEGCFSNNENQAFLSSSLLFCRRRQRRGRMIRILGGDREGGRGAGGDASCCPLPAPPLPSMQSTSHDQTSG